MVQQDHPEPVLAPDSHLRSGPDRISYMTRLNEERQKLLDERATKYEQINALKTNHPQNPKQQFNNAMNEIDQQSNGNQPIKTIQQGNVRVAVFENEFRGRDGNTVRTCAAVAERTYYDKNTNEHKSANSFNQSELLQLSEAARSAANFMQQHKEETRSQSYSQQKSEAVDAMANELENSQTNQQSNTQSHGHSR